MDRSTVTTIAKAMGGEIRCSTGKRYAIYQLPNDEKTLEFRDKIPFLSLWGGNGNIKDTPPITVYFDQLKDGYVCEVARAIE